MQYTVSFSSDLSSMSEEFTWNKQWLRLVTTTQHNVGQIMHSITVLGYLKKLIQRKHLFETDNLVELRYSA